MGNDVEDPWTPARFVLGDTNPLLQAGFDIGAMARNLYPADCKNAAMQRAAFLFSVACAHVSDMPCSHERADFIAGVKKTLAGHVGYFTAQKVVAERCDEDEALFGFAIDPQPAGEAPATVPCGIPSLLDFEPLKKALAVVLDCAAPAIARLHELNARHFHERQALFAQMGLPSAAADLLGCAAGADAISAHYLIHPNGVLPLSTGLAQNLAEFLRMYRASMEAHRVKCEQVAILHGAPAGEA